MKGKTNLIPLVQLWKRNTIPILCLHRHKPGLISRGSLPLTNFQFFRKLLQSFWCYWLFYTRTWNCWYFDTHVKEAPSTFKFFVLYCFLVLKIALGSSSQELTGSRAETAGVETHIELYYISLLSGYGNLCKDTIMNNNKDCRVGQLTNRDLHRADVGQTTGSFFPHKNVYSYFLFWKWLLRAWIKIWRGSITFVEKFTFAELSTLFFRISKQTCVFQFQQYLKSKLKEASLG